MRIANRQLMQGCTRQASGPAPRTQRSRIVRGALASLFHLPLI